MNEKILTSWVQDIKNAGENDKLGAEAERQRTIAATVIVESRGAIYWEELLAAIRLQAIDCKEIGVTVEVSKDDHKTEHESTISIAASSGFPSARFAWTYLTYQTNGKTLVVRQLRDTETEQKIEQVPFAVSSAGELSLYYHRKSAAPAQFAETLLRQMVNYVLHPPAFITQDQIEID
jgi:hypothetical protein